MTALEDENATTSLSPRSSQSASPTKNPKQAVNKKKELLHIEGR